MGSGEQSRKRSKNVCVRCQRQKIKCSGSKPCNSCSKRNLSCIFNNMDRKVLVTRGYISELQRKAACIENQVGDQSLSNLSREIQFDPAGDETPDNERPYPAEDIGDFQGLENPETGLVNPLATGPPTFMSSGNGRMRVLSIAHRHAYNEALPTEALTFEGTAYDLSDESRTDSIPEQPIIPTLDHALYLINMVNFRCGQLYHLFDEAMQLLPDHNRLYSSPLVSTEILCCIAIFYQSLDCRSPAHNYVGQAMRMAMSHGMHTCMSVGDLGLHVVERCRKIWWTVYVLDRQMSCIQGLPQSVDDRFVQSSLPSSSGPAGKLTTLGMHIKLCRRVAEINNKVYAIDGRFNQTFLLSTKEALSNIAVLADELRETFPLHLNGTDSGMPRTSACLHLFYQQVSPQLEQDLSMNT
ncbi:hypothetical protein PENNAL_c0161G04641 [Penicillium nalgiovense]|uniref:Zn(2)-C6 fungal-type domain-containing protein n=1 Tax=Penicillium nalgiovense TaxID=60175 RepID=A0A1V6WXZ3_PENNA|nr:hypothetical protein PENNAL_c0161G04641 [Penicillium nalgiovense]